MAQKVSARKAQEAQQETTTEVTAVAVQDTQPLIPAQPVVATSPLDLPTEVFRAGLDRRKANRETLMEWIRAALVEGVDYGRIHSVGKAKCPLAAQGKAEECKEPKHWSKQSLWKPGAEKICGMLGVSVNFPTLHDYEQAALAGCVIQAIILRCEIHDSSGRVVADGVGARSLEQDYGDLNKALKMAEKSAHIDATLRMAGLSEVFTQDLEDMPKGEQEPLVLTLNNGQKSVNSDDTKRTSPAQLRRLEARIQELKLSREWVKAKMVKNWNGKFQHFTDLTTEAYERLYAKLDDWAERKAIQEEARKAIATV
jgi:hypothetical protein